MRREFVTFKYMKKIASFILIFLLFPAPALAEDAVPVPVDVSLAFDRIEPGQFGMVLVTGWDVASAEGTFDGRPVSFQRQGESLVGFLAASLGIDRSNQFVDIRVTLYSGEVLDYHLPIAIGWDQYGRQEIKIPSSLGYLLEPEVNDTETTLLMQIYGQSTPQRYWDGALEMPLNGTTTSPFGALRSYNGGVFIGRHTGQDLFARASTPVKASAPGRVVLAEELDIHGKMVIVDHGWGVFTGYCHFSEIQVQPGQMVHTGDVLGLSGNTGRSSGPHLHWELAVGGTWVDPLSWTPPPLPEISRAAYSAGSSVISTAINVSPK